MKNSDLKIIFLGTPEFALPSLKILHENAFNIQCVITQPDRPSGRGHKLIECPVKKFALEKKLIIHQPERISKDTELLKLLKELQPDLMVTAAFGQILSQEVLDIASWGVWNVHASLLPRWRGAAPIQWALLEGDKETGITIMQTEKGLDTGPILNIQALPINKQDTSNTLLDSLAELGASLLLETIKLKQGGKLTPQAQGDSQANYASKITKEMSLIKIAELTELDSILRKQRALQPWPGLTILEKQTNETLKVFEIEKDLEFANQFANLETEKQDSEKLYTNAVDGQIYKTNKNTNQIFIKTPDGGLAIGQVQAPNKNKVPALVWLNGTLNSRKCNLNEINFE